MSFLSIIVGVALILYFGAYFIIVMSKANDNPEDASHCPTIYKCYACNWKGASPNMQANSSGTSTKVPITYTCPMCGTLV